MVHECSDELAAALPRQLALKKSRHRFPESLRAEQSRGQQRGEHAGHRRRVHVTVFFGQTNSGGLKRDELNHPIEEDCTAAKKPNGLAHQGGVEASPEVIAQPFRIKLTALGGCFCTFV